MIQKLIDIGDYGGACDQLERAALRTDGVEPPPDFIGCDGASTVHTLIGEVMDVLECD